MDSYQMDSYQMDSYQQTQRLMNSPSGVSYSVRYYDKRKQQSV